MRRAALLVLGGCFTNPVVAVDQDSLAMPRGTSRDVAVTVDGRPELDYVVWTIDDPTIASVTPSFDRVHLRIGGKREGDTVVHVDTHGELFDIPTHVDPPAIVKIWIEPTQVVTNVGASVRVSAQGLDTVLAIQDITFASRWAVRDPALASLDRAGMMLQAMGEGETTLHVEFGDQVTVAPITIYK